MDLGNKYFLIIGLVAIVGVIAVSYNSLKDSDQRYTQEQNAQSNLYDYNGRESQANKDMTENKNGKYKKAPEMNLEKGKDYSAEIVTDKGTIKVDLFESNYPNTVNNFVFLANEKFYDDTFFHRVISGFMIQGGDPTGTGTGGPGYRFNDEKISDEYLRGTIAMANSGPNTNGSQFFIMHKDYPLPKNYTIFGRAADAESLKTLDAIAGVQVTTSPMGEKSVPLEKVYIKSVNVVVK